MLLYDFKVKIQIGKISLLVQNSFYLFGLSDRVLTHELEQKYEGDRNSF